MRLHIKFLFPLLVPTDFHHENYPPHDILVCMYVSNNLSGNSSFRLAVISDLESKLEIDSTTSLSMKMIRLDESDLFGDCMLERGQCVYTPSQAPRSAELEFYRGIDWMPTKQTAV